ncbi:MAG TPA: FAD-linked oxidase C-terminal domain-containing protein, partial [Micromonosporaceae bacterium]|nr:FAD-linked oxidase C-terminal domain-containing protein [Micromonosporaceae bacterium]
MPAGVVDDLAAQLRRELGGAAVVTEEAARRTYECDGLAHYRATPALVVLPADAAQVQAVVRACGAAGVPWVARGSGTGLSGGALPVADGVLVVTSRMRRILEVDLANARALVEPGVVNLAISQAVGAAGWYYAPDPSSQLVCSIGGNVAENSGGAHCVKYGFTVHHVTGIEVCTPDGELAWLGSAKAAEAPGYDLAGVFIGSEGTLGIATKVAVRLLRRPEAVSTMLAAFRTVAEAGAATSAVIAAGLTPAAAEIMDALAIQGAERAVDCGYPPGAGAVLIVEVDGPAVEVAEEEAAVRALCVEAGAFEVRVAADAAARQAIWTGRRSAFAAVGRISPHYIVQDGVIPRTALAEVLAEIDAMATAAGIRVANVFHAGDGNLHPLVLYDATVPGEYEAAEQVSGAILDLCVSTGGSITGEHGVGVDKAAKMPRMFSAEDLDTMQ